MVNTAITQREIESRIFEIRSRQVMVDSDLAEYYGVETKVLNQAMKRNIERFPKEFCFQLTKEEYDSLRSQNVTLEKSSLRSQNATLESKRGKHKKYLPYVFTEQGVAMLSAVLKSETAVKMSVRIMNAFVGMRRFLVKNADVFRRIEHLEINQKEHKQESDEKFDKIFKALD